MPEDNGGPWVSLTKFFTLRDEDTKRAARSQERTTDQIYLLRSSIHSLDRKHAALTVEVDDIKVQLDKVRSKLENPAFGTSAAMEKRLGELDQTIQQHLPGMQAASLVRATAQFLAVMGSGAALVLGILNQLGLL